MPSESRLPYTLAFAGSGARPRIQSESGAVVEVILAPCVRWNETTLHPELESKVAVGCPLSREKYMQSTIVLTCMEKKKKECCQRTFC